MKQNDSVETRKKIYIYHTLLVYEKFPLPINGKEMDDQTTTDHKVLCLYVGKETR